MYLDHTVKIKLRTVDLLKKMNSTYPKATSDFDKDFLWCLLNGVFTKDELKLCGNASSLRTLKPDKLKLVKGSVKVWLIVMSLLYTNATTDLVLFISII